MKDLSIYSPDFVPKANCLFYSKICILISLCVGISNSIVLFKMMVY